MKTERTPPPTVYPGPDWHSQQWSKRASPAERLGRLIARRRRLIAALLLCAAAALAVQHLTPAAPATAAVMVVAHDLPSGHVLANADLHAADVDPVMVPDGSFDATSAAWVGGQLSGPLRRGEVLTDASLLGAGLLTGAVAGSQAVPLRLSDPSTLSLLRQGQLVTVILSSSKGLDGPVTNEVLADQVPVLWTPALAPTSGGLFPARDNEGIVVVAASPDQAVQLAGAISRGKVSLILLN